MDEPAPPPAPAAPGVESAEVELFVDTQTYDPGSGFLVLEGWAADFPGLSAGHGGPAGDGDFGPRYWARGVSGPVRFAEATLAAELRPGDVVLEVGPRPALAAAIAELVPGRPILASMSRDRSGPAALATALAGLYAAGRTIDWARAQPGRRRIRLPAYPWQGRRYWFDDEGEPARPVELPPGELALLAEHRIYERVVVPAAWHVARLLDVARERSPGVPFSLEGLTFPEAMTDPRGRSIALRLGPTGEFALGSLDRAGLRADHALGRIVPGAGEGEEPFDPATTEARCPSILAGAELYAVLGERGFGLGERFRRVESIRVGDGEGLGRLLATPSGGRMVDPGLLASVFQLVGPVLAKA